MISPPFCQKLRPFCHTAAQGLSPRPPPPPVGSTQPLLLQGTTTRSASPTASGTLTESATATATRTASRTGSGTLTPSRTATRTATPTYADGTGHLSHNPGGPQKGHAAVHAVGLKSAAFHTVPSTFSFLTLHSLVALHTSPSYHRGGGWAYSPPSVNQLKDDLYLLSGENGWDFFLNSKELILGKKFYVVDYN